MTTPQLLFGKVAEFNFLPSRTLHTSRYDRYASPGLAQVVQGQPCWRRAWHRQWSALILKALDVGAIQHTRHPELALGLLPLPALKRLAGRVGMVLSGASVRHTIAGEKLRTLQGVLGDELLTFARRDSGRYDSGLAHGSEIEKMPASLIEIEALGYGTLLASVSQSPPALARRFELKLPLNTQASDAPLSAAPALRLCLSVLQDMDSAWCSLFPANR